MLYVFDFYLGLKLLNFSQVVELHIFLNFLGTLWSLICTGAEYTQL